MQCLDPSEQLAVVIVHVYVIGHAILLGVLQSCAKVLHHSPSKDVLKKLANHQHGPQESEATVREVDLMLALQCGV